jgi:hypothetical protein
MPSLFLKADFTQVLWDWPGNVSINQTLYGIEHKNMFFNLTVLSLRSFKKMIKVLAI